MACEHWKDEWVASLYGELDPDEESRLSRHLAFCSGCRERLDRLSDARRVLQESAPPVPPAPRVVILRPAPLRRPLWAFAAGAACTGILFFAGMLAGARWTTETTSLVPGPGTADAGGLQAAERPVTPAELQHALQSQTEAFEQKLARQSDRSESGSETLRSDEFLTRRELDEELSRLRRGVNIDRARDFEFLLGEIAATEIRAGTWIGETQQALRAVALRNDPRFSEQ